MASDAPPFRKTRWTAALLIVLAGAVFNLFLLVTDSHANCQVTTVTSTGPAPGPAANYVETTRACGGPDVSDFLYVLAVAGFLLLPEVKTLKIGGLEFQRLTREVQQQTDEITKLSQQISAVFHNSQTLNLVLGAADLAAAATQGDVVAGSQDANEVLRDLLGPASP